MSDTPPVVGVSEAYSACTVASDAAGSAKCCDPISPDPFEKIPEYRSGEVSGAAGPAAGAVSQVLTDSVSGPAASRCLVGLNHSGKPGPPMTPKPCSSPCGSVTDSVT